MPPSDRGINLGGDPTAELVQRAATGHDFGEDLADLSGPRGRLDLGRGSRAVPTGLKVNAERFLHEPGDALPARRPRGVDDVLQPGRGEAGTVRAQCLTASGARSTWPGRMRSGSGPMTSLLTAYH